MFSELDYSEVESNTAAFKASFISSVSSSLNVPQDSVIVCSVRAGSTLFSYKVAAEDNEEAGAISAELDDENTVVYDGLGEEFGASLTLQVPCITSMHVNV